MPCTRYKRTVNTFVNGKGPHILEEKCIFVYQYSLFRSLIDYNPFLRGQWVDCTALGNPNQRLNACCVLFPFYAMAYVIKCTCIYIQGIRVERKKERRGGVSTV
jgi:hypothetical protein